MDFLNLIAGIHEQTGRDIPSVTTARSTRRSGMRRPAILRAAQLDPLGWALLEGVFPSRQEALDSTNLLADLRVR